IYIVIIVEKLTPGHVLTGHMDPNIDPAVIEKQREELGWNYPWPEQYGRWVAGVVQGDFGKSFRHKVDVTELIGQRLINTFWLTLPALIITYLIAIPLGIISGRYNDRLIDQAITGYTYIGFATPIFIFALVMVWLFGFQLDLFPTGGSVKPGLTPGSF